MLTGNINMMRVKSPEYKEAYVRRGDMQEVLEGAAEIQKNK
jgi:hypothetical protein